jgi:hypothetical protein
MERRVDLDAIGMICGSDKSSTVKNNHDYLRHYEWVFGEYRDQKINVIEIGVQKGPSLKAWKWYFSQATIIGIDIQPRCRNLREDRVEIEIGSQADVEFMQGVCRKYPPTIIIDDGSHLAEHNIVTFEATFPLLPPGGLYIVEDMGCHFGTNADRWQTENKCDSPGYFLQLALNRVAMDRNDQSKGPPKEIAETIDTVMAIGGAVIIRKADPEHDVQAALATIAKYGQTHPLDADAQSRVATYVVDYAGPPEAALQAIEAAIAEGGATPERARVHALVLMAAGDTAGAAAQLAEADASGTPEGPLRKRLSQLRAKLQSMEKQAARKARAANPA